jgi:hypothetical protein
MARLIMSLEGGVKEEGACGYGATAGRGMRRGGGKWSVVLHGGEAKRLEMGDYLDRWGPPISDKRKRREGGGGMGQGGQIGPARLTGSRVQRRGWRGRERERERGRGRVGLGLLEREEGRERRGGLEEFYVFC